MNKSLFLDGFKQRIQERFNLSADYAFEVLSIAAFLDMTFDEVVANVSTLVNGNGSHDAGLDGIYLDEDERDCTLHVFQIKHNTKRAVVDSSEQSNSCIKIVICIRILDETTKAHFYYRRKRSCI